jgi:hypothetical protein
MYPQAPLMLLLKLQALPKLLFQTFKVHKALQVQLGRQVHKELLALQVQLDLQVSLVQSVLAVLQVQLVLSVSLVLLVSLAQSV